MNTTMTKSGAPTAPPSSSSRSSPTLWITRSGYLSFWLHDPSRRGADVAQPRPVVEPAQRVRRPPVDPAEQAHHSRHDQGADERGVDRGGQRQADADGLDDHNLGQAEGQEDG